MSPRKQTIPSSSVNKFKVLEIEECSDTDSDEEIPLETVEKTLTPRKKKKVSGKPKDIQSEWTKKSELKAWTPEWIRWNLENKKARGIRLLDTWTHKKRKSEVMDKLIDQLLLLRDQEYREVILELRRAPQWI